MVKFFCLPNLSVVKKKKSKAFSKFADGNEKGSSKGDLRVKPIDNFSPSPEYGLKEHVSKSLDKESSITSMVLSVDSFARAEPTEAEVYEGDDELGEFRSMQRDYTDLDLQLASHGSKTGLNLYVSEKTETNKEKAMELTASSESPVLKRSCSNIETMQAKQWKSSSSDSVETALEAMERSDFFLGGAGCRRGGHS